MENINYNDLINEFYSDNTECNALKKKVKTQSDTIKAYLMNDCDSKTFTTDKNIVASITEAKSESFEEDKLIEYLEQNYNIPGVIITKKEIDYNALEDAIYHNNINAADLAQFKHTSISYRLNCKLKK